MKNHINIIFKLQQLLFTKHFGNVTFKLQRPASIPNRPLEAKENKDCMSMGIFVVIDEITNCKIL